MDLTELLMGLEEETGIQVWPDICEDEAAKTYITYINLYTPMDYDYFGKKKQIRDYLETNGFIVKSINTRVESDGTVKVRRTTFDCSYAEMRETEE
jgi:hypothetical protein